MPNITAPEAPVPIVDENNIMLEHFQRWVESMTNEDILIGVGSPEGIVEARQGRRYMDENGTTGSILYIKKFDEVLGDVSQGWVLV